MFREEKEKNSAERNVREARSGIPDYSSYSSYYSLIILILLLLLLSLVLLLLLQLPLLLRAALRGHRVGPGHVPGRSPLVPPAARWPRRPLRGLSSPPPHPLSSPPLSASSLLSSPLVQINRGRPAGIGHPGAVTAHHSHWLRRGGRRLSCIYIYIHICPRQLHLPTHPGTSPIRRGQIVSI